MSMSSRLPRVSGASIGCGCAGAMACLALMLLIAVEWACDFDVAGATWRGDCGDDALEDETDERLLLLDAIVADVGWRR